MTSVTGPTWCETDPPEDCLCGWVSRSDTSGWELRRTHPECPVHHRLVRTHPSSGEPRIHP
jgi:hypothetical protein